MSSHNQGYTQIYETAASPLSQRKIQLRNVAAIPAARSPSRADVLESLIPLSRNPWSGISTMTSHTPVLH
ncbi:hypothetical protein FBU30_001298, partial [Linnemannia zychae]